MRSAPVVLAALLAVATLPALPGTTAAPCGGVPISTGFGGPYYVVSDGGPAEGYAVSQWFYQEANGEDGLQRGGRVWLTGEYDPCPTPGYEPGAEGAPDVLLGGTAVPLGQPPGAVPLPGAVILTMVPGSPPLIQNAFGHDCGPLATTPTSVSVTCQAPATLPPGFVGRCESPTVVAGQIAAGVPAGHSVAGRIACGASDVGCSTAASPISACAESAPTSEALPVTCEGSVTPGVYAIWLVYCMF